MTKLTKNSLTAGLALLIVFFFTSCAEDEQPGLRIPPGNSLYVASAIIAPPAKTETEVNTRVAGDDVLVTVTAGSLGIFRSKGTGYTETLNNKKYAYTGADNGWQPATAGDTLFLNGDDAEVCAYYPHNADAAYQDATALPLYSGKYTGTGALHDPNDLCYAIYRTVNAARRATTFEMKHALSLLEFRISKEAGYVGDCRITSIAVMNPDLLTESSIDITTGTYGTTATKGTITYNPGADADGILIESIAVTTGALLVPFTPTSEGLAIAFAVNGTPVEANIPTTDIAQLEAGRRYSVKVTMKAGSMEVTGVDMMPWDEVGVGGDDYTWYPVQEKEKDPIDIGLDFVIAPGNLMAKAKGNGYTYAFAKEQGYYSGIDQAEYNSAGGDYFCWNTLDPSLTNENQTEWKNERDVCSKIGDGEWQTPTQAQLQKLVELYTNKKAVWGTYEMSSETKEGWYFGTADVPDEANQDKYVFLPAAGYRIGTKWNSVGSIGYYWSSTSNGSGAHVLAFYDGGCSMDNGDYNYGLSVRCVKDKPKSIDIGQDFVIAPGNLIATADGNGGYTYAFAKVQGYTSGGADGTAYDSSGGDYFCWNTLDPVSVNAVTATWDDKHDPCRKVADGKWYTPTKEQMEALIGSSGGTRANYTMPDGSSTVSGHYLTAAYGTTIDPSNQDDYVFMPITTYRNADTDTWKSDNYSPGRLWTKTSEVTPDGIKYYFYAIEGGMFGQYVSSELASSGTFGFSIRCVRNK